MTNIAARSSTAVECESCASCAARGLSVWSNSDPAVEALLAKSRVKISYGSGQPIFAQGDVNAGIYCVSSGTVAIRRLDASGNSVLLKLAYPGDTLGYRSFLNGGEHKSSAEGIGPVTVCRIERCALQAAVAACPALSLGILSRAVADVDSAQAMLMQQATLSNRGRLCNLLIELVERHGSTHSDGSGSVQLPVSRRDLASMIGTRHETISRIMSRLEKNGVARFSGRNVVIPRLEALAAELSAALED
jgi:CRP/FNR family transcriptional regulator